MNIWLKLTAALALEIGSLSLLTTEVSLASLLIYLGLHGMASALVVWVAWMFLPAHYKQPAGPACALLWVFAFFVPALGGMLIFAVMHFALRFPHRVRSKRFAELRMPEFSGVQREATERSDLRAGDARSILKSTTLPLETRLRVLVAMQVMQPKAAVPLLLGLLSDPSEDIRLLAYSMMDAWEKDLVQKIQAAQAAYEVAQQGGTPTAVVNALRQLAELNWEQADSGLARGDLRRFALENAARFCENVLDIDTSMKGTWQLYTKVLIELGQLEKAAVAVDFAAEHLPAGIIWSLKGQIAYLRRDFDAVRLAASQIPAKELLMPTVAATASYWRSQRVTPIDLYV
jgi:polysaccharide biosynthesis protein PelE